MVQGLPGYSLDTLDKAGHRVGLRRRPTGFGGSLHRPSPTPGQWAAPPGHIVSRYHADTSALQPGHLRRTKSVEFHQFLTADQLFCSCNEANSTQLTVGVTWRAVALAG